MACRKKGGCKVLLCLGLIVVASSLCHCTEPIGIQTSDTSVAWTLKSRENSTLIQGNGKGGGSGDLRHGRLLIGRQAAKLKGIKSLKNILDADADYQSDMGWEEPKHHKGQVDGSVRQDSAAVERLLQMEPKVECTGDSMKLKVQDADSTPGSLLFVDRGSHLSPLPLSKLPSSCGYTMRSSWRDLVLVAPYDGCFVTLEEDSYILPLRWWGLPVRMSCPVMRQSSPNPPMVTCHAEGMVVKTEWAISVNKIKVNLTGNWEPLMTVSSRCGFSVVVHPEGVVISAHYAPCVEIKDGMFTIDLAGDGEIKVSCPSMSPLHPKPPQSTTESPNQQTRMPNKGVYPSHPWSPHPLPSTHAPHQNPKIPQQPAIPQVPVYPQYPKISNQTPTQRPRDIDQPPKQSQWPYFPFYPNPFHPYPIKTNTPPRPTPAVQPPPHVTQTTPHVTKIPDDQQSQKTVPPTKSATTPEGQLYQLLNPFPFYPWPAQPEKPAVLPQATQPPKGQVEQPFYPYPFYVWPSNPDTHPVVPAQKPEVQPTPTTLPPVTQPPNGQMQPFYPHPFYPQPPKHETLPTQKPAEPPGTSQKPPVTQFWGQERKPFYPFPFYPQPPASEVPQSQVQQPRYPQYPEPSKPEKPSPGKLPSPPATEAPSPPATEAPSPPATEAPSPPATEAPQGQVHQPFYPYPFYPYPFYHLFKPEGPSEKPVPPTQQTPSQMSKGQVQQPLNPLYPEASKPEAPENPSPGIVPPAPGSQPFYPQPPASEAPQGQVHQPFYPYPFYYPFKPEGPSEKPVPPTQQMPKGQEQQPLNPLHPEASKPEAPENASPGKVPLAPGSQPFYPQPPKPPASEAPQAPGSQPFYPFPFYLQPPASEAPQGQVLKPFYPQQPQIPGAQTNPNLPTTKKPVPDGQPPASKAHPQNPQPVTLPPGFTPQKPQQVTPANNEKPHEPANPQPSNFGLLPHPQPGNPYIPPVQCPQICPSGFSNCCLQIAYHQHHHHIVPAGLESKGGLPVYPGLPFFPALGYSNFGYGLESAPLPHKPTEATTTSVSTTVTSAPENVQAVGEYWSQIAPQSLPFGSQPELQPFFQPPDGNPAALPGSYPDKLAKPELPMHPYVVPYNSQYLGGPTDVGPPKFPQSLSPTHSNTPSKPQDAGSDPINQMLQYYDSYNLQPPKQQYHKLSSGDMKNPSEPEHPMKPYFMSYNTQYLQQPHTSKQQNKQLTAKELQPPGKRSSESEPPKHPQDQRKLLDPPLIPYYMLQDSQAPPYNGSSKPQPPVSDSKKSSKPEPQMHSYFEPNGYVLLQQGPPGRVPSSSPESPLPSRDLVHDMHEFLAPKPQRHRNGKPQHPQNLKQPQGTHPKQLAMYGLLPENADYMPSPMGEESTEGLTLYYSAPNGPHPASLPQDPSFNPAHLKPELFKDVWKFVIPLGSSRRTPPHDPGQSSQRLGSAANHQPNGFLNQPIEREGGHQKQKQS